MSDIAVRAEPDDPLAGRERGWWRVAVAAALVLFVPVTPLVSIMLPVDQTILLLAPALAACALVGWWAGGRLSLALVWTAIAAWVLWQATVGEGAIALITCGWAVLLAAAFAALSTWRPRAITGPRRFFPTAVTAIAITLILASIVALAMPGGVNAVTDVLRTAVGQRSEAALAGWRQATSTKEWMSVLADHPDLGELGKAMEGQLQGAPVYAVLLFPSMLALESLAVLALAWAVYHRVGRARLGAPLASLRDFRFNDQLVWGLVIGLLLVVIPWFSALSGAGANLLVFFGTIYAVRGLGVGLWFLAPGRLVMALLIAFSLFFWNVLGVLALGLGLGDTWLDWRARAARQQADRK